MTTITHPNLPLTWRWCRFDELSLRELQDIYMARQLVFAIEQECVYLDVDGFDEFSYHLAAWSPGQRVPLAYARLVDAGGKYPEPSMGRVLTTAAARGTGLGRELVGRLIEHASLAWPETGIRISAQSRLQRFYTEFNFVPVGDEYLEDDLPHIQMHRPG